MSSPRRIIIVLLRNDLRIHDQQHFHSAHDAATNGDVSHVLPLYVWDERHVELSGLPGYQRQGPEARTRLCNFWRTGPLRLRWVLILTAVLSVNRPAGSCAKRSTT
jgi:deoxyribodipyrimidine photo-lyase